MSVPVGMVWVGEAVGVSVVVGGGEAVAGWVRGEALGWRCGAAVGIGRSVALGCGRGAWVGGRDVGRCGRVGAGGVVGSGAVAVGGGASAQSAAPAGGGGFAPQPQPSMPPGLTTVLLAPSVAAAHRPFRH